MTCHALLTPDRPPMPSASDRLGQINTLAHTLYDAVEQGASSARLRGLVVEIQNLACIGAAYERRRERGETINEGVNR